MKLKYALTSLTPQELLKAVAENPYKDYLFIRQKKSGDGRYKNDTAGFVAEVKTLEELKTEIEGLDVDAPETFVRNLLKTFVVGEVGEKYLPQFLAEHINQTKFAQGHGRVMETLLTLSFPDIDIDAQAQMVRDLTVFAKIKQIAEQMHKMANTIDDLGIALHSRVLSGEMTMIDAKTHLRDMLENSEVISKKMKP